ncbi:MAG: oligosaccharide flippase family protein [Saprospiraceae bacterium]
MIKKLKSVFLNPSEGAYRLRQIAYTGLSSIAAKGINAIVTLISVPLAYNYLGEERYGLMMIVLSVVSMLHFADLGLGFSLQNKLPTLLQEESKLQLKKYISSTFLLLVGVSVFLVLCLSLSWSYINWSEVLNVKGDLANSEAETSVLVFVLCFLISLPLSIIQKIQNGYQKAYYNEAFKAVGNLLGLLLLVFFIRQNQGVPFLILAIYGSVTLSLMGNFIYKLFWKDSALAPKLKYLDASCFKELFNDGVKFFIIQVMSILTIALDSLIIARYISAEAVAGYNIGFRIVMLLMIPSLAFISPMLFAFNDAIAKNDKAWVVNASRKAVKVCLALSVTLSLLLLLGGNLFIKLWIGCHAMLDFTLITAFAVYIFFYNFNNLFSTIMLSDQFLKYCFLYYPIAAITSFILKVVLIKTIGIPGVLYGTVIGITILFILPSSIILRKLKYL